MGEKFAANPVTGTASLSVPVATSPGRGGFHPEISLSYDSGAGNGPFGLGWHLSVPNVSRKTDKRLPEYDDQGESDVFILSGAEDLVPSLVKDATGWVREVIQEGDSRVERFRPRVEGLFARIERHTGATGGDVYWVAITKDNLRSTYGRSPEARLSDPRDPTRIFTWLLERTEDGKGNVIAYRYKSEDMAGVQPTLSEMPRLDGSAPCANLYLERIRYGNLAPIEQDDPVPNDPAAWLFEVVFDYGEHEAPGPETAQGPEPTPGKSWAVRPDPFSTYRAGFEVRTYRLCRRVLMFHRFSELTPNPCLVRSTELTYSVPEDEESACLTKLISIQHRGHMWNPLEARYESRALPALQLSYVARSIDTTVRSLDPETLRSLPGGVHGPSRQWVDLDGEGIPGVLTEVQGALYYQRNLGKGQLAPAEVLRTRPSMSALAAGHQQLMDLGGDGRLDLVQLAPPLAGFHTREADGAWAAFQPFVHQPNIDWNDPHLHFIDLNGDGFEDLLLSKDDVFVWYPSEGKKGYGPPRAFPRPRDEAKGPALVFADETHSVFLADLSGDGLVDLCRIRNGEICYWPNLGHGRFGSKITMDASPVFDSYEEFDARQIRFADVDGSGTSDLFYFGREPRLWFNQAGNSWSAARSLPAFPSQDPESTISVVDLLGTGTTCIVWTSPLPAHAQGSVQYIDLLRDPDAPDTTLATRKPHLLQTITNNLGLQTTLEHRPATHLYLEDRAAGIPWVTRLHFPVHVLTRVETYDAVMRARFVSRYRYRHGYYDGAERELRGFGFVEQQDTDSVSAFMGHGDFTQALPAANTEYPQAPVITRTWFHTGAWLEADTVSAYYQKNEYYRGDPAAIFLDDTILPPDLTAEEAREACRALKGQILRQEVYEGLPDQPFVAKTDPYTTSERSYEVRRIQPPQGETMGVFFVHPREAVDSRYEQVHDDPRVQHAFTLDVDDYGNVTRSAAVAYPRRIAPADLPEQSTLAITCTKSRFAHSVAGLGGYRVGAPVATLTFELTLASSPSGPLSFEQMRAFLDASSPLAYHEKPTSGTTQRRLIEAAATLYYNSDTLPGVLPFGQVDRRALPYQTYGLAFTPGLLAQLYEGRVDDAMLSSEGYVSFPGDQELAAEGAEIALGRWIPSGTQMPSAELFYLPKSFADPMGNVTKIAHDTPYTLLLVQVIDPLGNQTIVENDYRVLGPRMITDPNGNQGEAKFDELGMLAATAVKGKPDKSRTIVDGYDDTGAAILKTVVEQQAEGDTLEDPTTTIEYDFYKAAKNGQPAAPSVVHVKAREVHGAANTAFQESYTYSDGSGHEVMKKVQAEPDPAEPNKPRWVGTGRTVLNNKGNPVKKYEPYFSPTFLYEDEKDIVEQGVTPILQYDPLGRLVRTDLPNGTFSRVVIGAWAQETWDENDTVLESRWYAARKPGTPPPSADFDPDQWALQIEAAKLIGAPAAAAAVAHAATPSVTVFDSMGRAFLAIADNGGGKKIPTRSTLDIEGNPLIITDARKNAAMVYAYNLVGQSCLQVSVDAGEKRALSNVAGSPARVWHGVPEKPGYHVIRTTYDELQRPTGVLVSTAGAQGILAERTIYGDSSDPAEAPADPAARNLRGKPYMQFDGAGRVALELYDFKGNLGVSSRRLASNYKATPSWSPPAALETTAFTTTTTYDALNRPTSVRTPDKSETLRGYNAAGLLETIQVKLRGSDVRTHFVENVDYNAKGQRTRVEHANGIVCTYEYDEETFRLTRARTIRGQAEVLQDLRHTYDPVGNITAIRDGYWELWKKNHVDNAGVTPISKYVYDAMYRLIWAWSREHGGQNADVQQDQNGFPIVHPAHANDFQTMRNYVEVYDYDDVGNFRSMKHRPLDGAPTLGDTAISVGANGWTRWYETAMGSNRLLSTSLPGDGKDAPYSAKYTHDQHGNMTSMPHLPGMGWDFRDRMVSADTGGGGVVYFTYDAGGQRVRKVWEHGSLVDETVYVGAFEIYRERQGAAKETVIERETLHVMDGDRRVAMQETKTVDKAVTGFMVESRVRYQVANHLSSVTLELDEAGVPITYEEYHPYGATAYHAERDGSAVSAKRYRYSGKERDGATSLGYHGARYYVPWLGRWSSTDPLGLRDSLCLYAYVADNPLIRTDMTGSACDSSTTTCVDPAASISYSGVIQQSSENANAVDQINDDNARAETARQSGSLGPPVDNQGRPFPPNTPEEGKKLVEKISKDLQQTEKAQLRAARDAPRGAAQLEAERQKAEAELKKDLPRTAASVTPVVGNAWTSYAHAIHGNYFTAGFYLAMAASDVVALKSLGVSVVRLGARSVASVGATEAVQAYEVGTFKSLQARSWVGDELDLHHVGQAHVMEQIVPGYTRAGGPAIALPSGEHALVPTLKGTIGLTPRQLLARDIWNLRQYTNAPNDSLRQLIQLNREMYPGAYAR